MTREIKWIRLIMPLMAVTFLIFSQSAFAQNDDNYQYNNNPENYDNSDEALIQPENDVNYNTFHDELSPYGRWIDYQGYGNVWVCNVAGFSPYNTGGRWAYSRFGWTWVSDYNWGWAPFHYGRWGYDNSFGYFWVPGYTWGPAWVSWRNGGDYYGWAPLSPGLNVGINVGVGIGAASWIFLPHRYMGYRNSYNYYAPRQQNVTIIRNTTIINNTHVYNNNRFVVGPDRRQVERYSGQRVQQQNIYVTNNRNDNRRNGNGIQMYHPNVNRGVVNEGSGVQNNRPDRATQDNVRQQPFDRRRIQNSVQQPQNNDVQGSNNPTNRIQQNREDRTERKDERNNSQRQQDWQGARDRMQQNNNQRRQQMNQAQQQQDAQRQQKMQQMNDRRDQMQQQMQQRRQDQDAQQQRQNQLQQRQHIDQQRQQQIQQRQQQNQQRQQQIQQRQEVNQQRSQPANRPAVQQGGGRRGKN